MENRARPFLRRASVSRTRERGSVMTLALGFLVVLLVIAAGVHALVLSQLRGSGRLRRQVAATELAAGGVARARAWFASSGYQLPPANLLIAGVPPRYGAGQAPVALPENHPSAYTDAYGTQRKDVVQDFARLLSAQRSPIGTYSVRAALIAVAPETWETVATGQVGEVRRSVGAVLMREAQALFADALFGRARVRLSGNGVVDSYDASLGAYGGANVFQTGNLRSNGDIVLSGNATIRGDAIPGPEGALSTSGNAQVTGVTDPADTEKVLPPVSVPPGAVDLGSLQLSGKKTRTLTAGTYLADGLSISGNAALIIDSSAGPVVLYLTGAASISGNGISNGGRPRDFQLFQVGGAPVSFSGNANFTGAVYAPDSSLSNSGNGTFYGSFIGNDISLSGNGGIHYDQSLRSLGGPPGPLRMVAQWSAAG